MKEEFDISKILGNGFVTKFPKSLIVIGGSIVIFVIVALVASNHYINEMLFLEGIEKSLPMFTETELRTYGEYYKNLEIEFQNDIASFIQNYANRTNRRGDKIRWGVYGKNNSEDLISNDFVDGVTIKYAKTKDRYDGESNFKDILIAVSIALDQDQSKDENIVKELIRELYRMSHTFSGTSTELYPCTHGCFCDFYHCSDAHNMIPFSHCNIKYQPFRVKAHEEFPDYTEEENFRIIGIEGECEVCKEKDVPCYQQRGCTQNGTCYHGNEAESSDGGGDSDDGDGGGEEVHEHSLGREEPTPEQCTHWVAVYECNDDGSGEHDCSGSPIGCAGYYRCEGHPHYECPDGHYYICCMGHTNVTISIKIMYLEEMLDVIKNGYNEG